MSAAEAADHPDTGSLVTTACGGTIRLTPDTPTALFRGQVVYFCLPDCKQIFERHPSASCLVGNPLLEIDS